uniref:glycosyltransferase family 9 protein n=1 Tax=Bacteroidota TaxID=976 RepID=UPI0040474654
MIKIVKLIFFKCLDLLVWKRKKSEQNSILLLRLDAIGDYILFRNFIEVLSQSEKFKGYKITLLGNDVWKSLAIALDGRFIDRFIWLDVKRFNDNYIYRYQFLKEITCINYRFVINSEYSRRFLDSDWIVNKVSANQKIGFDGNLSNRKKWQKLIGDGYYTRLIPSSREIMFEFYRNKEFFEILIGNQIFLDKAQIINHKIVSNISLPLSYAVLFLGSSKTCSKWPIKKFVQVANYVSLELGLNVVICGSTNDLCDAEEFNKEYNRTYFDFVGKTTLSELIKIFSGARLLVSNETSAPHFAVALDIPTVVLYNGNHFGRFTPYPSEMTDKYGVVCHPSIEQNPEAYKLLSNEYGYFSTLNIDEIEVKPVIEKINKIYNNLNL